MLSFVRRNLTLARRRLVAPPVRSICGVALVLGACGGGGGGGNGNGDISDDGDAGAQLRGTVPDHRRLVNRELEIRAVNGERSVATIGMDGRYQASGLSDGGPLLLRVEFGDGEAWYALVLLRSDGPTTANVHAYTDLALRNVLAAQDISIDELYDAEGPVSAEMMPDVQRVGAVSEAISSILSPSLEAYDLVGTDLTNVSFVADGQGVDEFLEVNPVLVERDSFTILATDPVTDTRTVVSASVPLSRDLSAIDGIAPEPPEIARALAAASDEIVLVWEAARDNIAVIRYEVSRDGRAIATTPYPVFSDAPLEAGAVFTYSVVAIDEAGNRSAPTPGSVASTLAAPDTTPPPAPIDVQVTVTLESARVSWTQSVIADVAAFRVLRSVGDGSLASLARSTSTTLIDPDLSAATEYCYQVVAIDASENDSPPSEVICATTEGTGMLTEPGRPPITLAPIVTAEQLTEEPPLVSAVFVGDVDRVILLLQGGEDPDLGRSRDGVTPLLVAAQEGETRIAELLVDAGASIDVGRREFTPLMIAAQNGHADTVEFLIGAGASLNAARESNWTALHSAVSFGRVEVTRLLVEAGAPLEASVRGGTPLTFAAQEGASEIASLLIAAGAALEGDPANGFTPVYIAAQNEHLPTLELLLDAGANPDDGGTSEPPLVHAVSVRANDSIRPLVGAGAGIDVQSDRRGWTALMWAANNDDAEAVDILLQLGADTSIESDAGETARDIALRLGHTELAGRL